MRRGIVHWGLLENVLRLLRDDRLRGRGALDLATFHRYTWKKMEKQGEIRVNCKKPRMRLVSRLSAGPQRCVFCQVHRLRRDAMSQRDRQGS